MIATTYSTGDDTYKIDEKDVVISRVTNTEALQALETI